MPSRPLRPLALALAFALLPALSLAQPRAGDGAAPFARGRALVAVGEYAEGAEELEKGARQFPKEADAPSSLAEAFTLRLGLGQVEQAGADLERFGRLYGAARAGEAAAMAVRLAGRLVSRGQWAEVKKALSSSMAMVDRAGSLADRAEAHAFFGRAQLELGDRKAASAEYARVNELWKDPDRARRQIEAEGGDQATRQLGRALTAGGEARFFFAEQARAEAQALGAPVYRGKRDAASIRKHIDTSVAKWLAERRLAAERAEKAYLEVVNLTPVPPPRWVVASAERVGEMWWSFVVDMRKVEAPPLHDPTGKQSDAELRAAYRASIEQASEPFRARARAAFETCERQAARFERGDAFSAACSAWLDWDGKKPRARLDEIAPALRAPELPRAAVH